MELRRPDGSVLHIELPPGAMLYGGPLAPVEAKFGDVWIDDDGRVYRLTLRASCPTCGRPGAETWEFVPNGLDTYAV